MGSSAESLRRAAVELANRGRLGAAQRLLERAIARSDHDVDVRARISGTLALVHARRGDVALAERLCADAYTTSGIAPGTAALLAGQLATIAEWGGRLDDADRWLTRALPSIEEPVARANLLVNRANIGMQRRELDRAVDDTAEAIGIFERNNMPVDAAEARHNLGYIDLLRGHIVGALTEMTRARPVLAEASTAANAISNLDRAQVLRDAGVMREAENLLADAVETLGRARMPRERAEAEFALARSLLSHDPVRARRVAASAVRRFRSVQNERWAVRAESLQLRAELSGGQLSRRGIRVPEATRSPRLAQIEAVASSLDRFGSRNDAVALRLSYELWAARRGSAPARASTRVPRSASIDVRILRHEVRAARAEGRGRHAEARRHARAGLDELFTWQRQFGSLDLQTSVVWQGNGLIGTGLQSAACSGRPDVVFEWSERARHLNLQVVPLRPPPDPELAAELAELRTLRAEGDGWLSSPRARELQNRARERQWSGTRSAAVHEHATLDEAQGTLDADTAIVAFVYAGDTVEALAVTAESVQLVGLGDWEGIRTLLPGLRGDLDMVAAVQHGPLAEVVRRSLEDRLAALSAALLSPVLDAVGDRRLVITAPGVLNGVPWSMLPPLRGRVFTLAASVSRWIRLGRTPSTPPQTAALASGPRVPRASEEVHTAAAAWDAPALFDPATIADLTGAAGEAAVLHIAAHGRHSADNPMFSGLELADGTLFGYDIDLIEKVPDTVILSACEVGRSSVRWGEEAVGMTRVWLHAGSRCVVAAPVVVADDDACELLGAMHEGLAAGVAPSEALAAASEKTGIVAPFQVHGAGF